MTEATFRVLHSGHIPVVDCTGEIDLNNVHELEAALTEAARQDAGVVVVSLAETTYLDSQGLRTIYTVGERLLTARQRLAIVAPSGSSPRRILEIAGVETAHPLFETLEDAIASRDR